MKAQGFNTGYSDDSHSLATLVQPNIVNNVTISPQVKPQKANHTQLVQSDIPVSIATTLNLDDIMDDSSVGLSADPMLSSLPVSPMPDEDSMDYGI